MSRIERICLVAATALAILAVADVISCHWTTQGIREGDWVVVLGCLGFFAGIGLRPRLANKLSLGVLAGFTCWLALEVGLTAITFNRGRPEAWYVWPPRLQRQVTPQNLPGVTPAGTFSINSLGIRGREFAADDRYRILCVGGSTTECFYLDDARTWPALLERDLAESLPGVWVGNVGRSGLTTTDHLTVLHHLPETREADCWVILCGANDMMQHINGGYEQGQRETLDRSFAYRRPGFTGRLDRPLYRNTYLFALVRNTTQWARTICKLDSARAVQDRSAAWYVEARERRRRSPKIDPLPDLTPMLAAYEKNLRGIIDLSRAQGKRLVFLTQAAVWSEPMPDDLERLCLGGRLPDGSYLSAPSMAHALAEFNDRMRALCAAERIACVDLAQHLPRTMDVFYDDCHFNEAGAAAVARLLAPAILKTDYDRNPGNLSVLSR